MSLRKGSKIIVAVGFLICFSCMGILYGNLSSTVTESQDMLSVKNRAIEQLKKEIEDRDTKSFTLENRILALEQENTQCSAANDKLAEKSQTLEKSLEELTVKAAEVNANLRKLQQREEDEQANHKADLQNNVNTLDELRRDLIREKASTSSCVGDLSTLKKQLGDSEDLREQQSIQLNKCLQGAGKAEIKVEADSEDVAQHQVQAPVQQEAPKPQQLVDSVDHNAPAPVPAQQPVIGGAPGLGDQIAALPNAVPAPRDPGHEAIQQQQVGAAPPPLQPAQPAHEAFVPLPVQPIQDQPLQPAAVQPALLQELQPAPQHP